MPGKVVLVNDRSLGRRLTGIGQYLASIVSHWPDQPRVELLSACYLRPIVRPIPPASGPGPNHLADLAPIRLHPLQTIASPRGSYRQRIFDWVKPRVEGAYGYWMRRVFDRFSCAGYFEPNHLPLFPCRPCVTSIHDLSVLDMPEVHPPDRVAAWQRRLEACLRWTTHFVCFTRATARRIHQVLGLPGAATTVIPLAPRWREAPESWDLSVIRTRLRLPDRYLLHLGTIEPRKNLRCLLDAYARKSAAWRRRTPLILAGMPGWGPDPFWRGLRGHPMADHVFTTDYLTDAQVCGLLLGARGLVLPSLYEGFGLPALEGMALGVPVIASNTTSLPEVCDSAAVLLPPEDVAAWAEWIEHVAEPGADNDRRIRAGRLRARQFSWERTAARHHDLLERVCEPGAGRPHRGEVAEPSPAAHPEPAAGRGP